MEIYCCQNSSADVDDKCMVCSSFDFKEDNSYYLYEIGEWRKFVLLTPRSLILTPY